MSSEDLLSQRYGAPSPRRRRLVVAACAALAAVALGWLVWTIAAHGNPSAKMDLESWEVVGVHEVQATVVLTIDDDAEDVECLLRALAEDKVTVGELSWSPDPDGGRRQTVSIRTEREATSVDEIGCTAEGQPRPR